MDGADITQEATITASHSDEAAKSTANSTTINARSYANAEDSVTFAENGQSSRRSDQTADEASKSTNTANANKTLATSPSDENSTANSSANNRSTTTTETSHCSFRSRSKHSANFDIGAWTNRANTR